MIEPPAVTFEDRDGTLARRCFLGHVWPGSRYTGLLSAFPETILIPGSRALS
jgi:hypothetical protein